MTKQEFAAKAVVYMLVGTLAVLIYFAALGGIWLLWAGVAARVWPAGPVEITHVDYWTFAGVWTLMVLVVRGIRANWG